MINYDFFIRKNYNNVTVSFGIMRGGSTLVFIKSGRGGHIEGENNRYLILAEDIRRQYGFSVVVCDNPLEEQRDNPLDGDLATALEALSVGGAVDRIIYVGYSAGANYGGWYARQYPLITDLLLINPVLNYNFHRLKANLTDFEGNVSFIMGESDPSAKWTAIIPRRDNVSIEVLPGFGHKIEDGVFNAKVIDFLRRCI